MKHIILASSSINRKALLERLAIPFTCISPDIDENQHPGEAPRDLALRLSLEKARKIAQAHPEALVIGSDQVCASDTQLINKPETHENALAQWEHLSGQSVVFYTGVAVLCQGKEYSAMVPTQVQFKKLSSEIIDAYLRKDQPYHCCAGFKIESMGILLTASVKSDDPTALIGLPLIKTVALMEQCGLTLLP